MALLAVLVDFPDTAKFLSADERAYVIWRKKYDNSSVGEDENFSVKHLLAAIKDWQVCYNQSFYYTTC
jgi:hypothetical protein